MSKAILIIIFIIGALGAAAQVKPDCINTCQKKKLVPYAPFIGINIIDDTSTSYVKVVGIIKNTAAETANLLPNDLLLKLNNIDIENVQHLQYMVAKKEPGELVQLNLLRDNKVIIKKLNLSHQYTREEFVIECCDEIINAKKQEKIQFFIYPKIDPKTFTIKADKTCSALIKISISNNAGTVLSSKEVLNNGEVAIPMDVSSLAKGKYTVLIESDGNNTVEKFIKN
jgi:hypothetical protein